MNYEHFQEITRRVKVFLQWAANDDSDTSDISRVMVFIRDPVFVDQVMRGKRPMEEYVQRCTQICDRINAFHWGGFNDEWYPHEVDEMWQLYTEHMRASAFIQLCNGQNLPPIDIEWLVFGLDANKCGNDAKRTNDSFLVIPGVF